MYSLRPCSLFLLQHLGATIAAPTSDALGLTLVPPPANPASNSSYKILLSPPPLAETILYPIPDSTITLAMNPRPHSPILPDDLHSCLYVTSERVLDHIRQHGDGPLASFDDPFTSDPVPDANCKFGVRSWYFPTPQGRVTYLTYGIVHTVLRGLLEYMLFPDPHYYFISFMVKDTKRGTVGVGSVNPAHK